MQTNYLTKAITSLGTLGFRTKPTDEALIVPILADISVLGETEVLIIGQTFQHTTLFNEIVRDNIIAMDVGVRYERIANSFNSIIDDAKGMVERMEKEDTSFLSKLRVGWMKLSRGTIQSRDSLQVTLVEKEQEHAQLVSEEKLKG